jgi:hypothetical protein
MNKLDINDNKKKDIEELARIFASKAPKETTYNNIKTQKYFTKTIKEEERPTIKDNLIHNNNVMTNNLFEPLPSKIY